MAQWATALDTKSNGQSLRADNGGKNSKCPLTRVSYDMIQLPT